MRLSARLTRKLGSLGEVFQRQLLRLAVPQRHLPVQRQPECSAAHTRQPLQDLHRLPILAEHQELVSLRNTPRRTRPTETTHHNARRRPD